ncbi:MAG: molecular chaperone DnaJ [Thermodesulfobacteriota bacterium]
MELVVAEQELLRSCEIIFGNELNISREFLEYLQISGIKSAYRKRAMETHPDRAAAVDAEILRQRNDLFHSVQEAYENLVAFLNAKEKGYRLPPLDIQPEWRHYSPPRPPPKQQPKPPQRPQAKRPQQAWQQAKPKQEPPKQEQAQAKPGFQQGPRQHATFWDTESLYQGPMPNRRLLLGHFLYYSGLINWRTIIQALVWQRTERPRLGELGQRFGMLSEDDILHILRNRPPLAPFGRSATEMGLLTEPQLQMLISHQKRLQRKFGEFFLEKRLFNPEELRQLIQRYQEHNARIAVEQSGMRFRF